jgi:hypothetical protein
MLVDDLETTIFEEQVDAEVFGLMSQEAYGDDEEYAMGMYFGDGKLEQYKKDVKLYVRAVKTIK